MGDRELERVYRMKGVNLFQSSGSSQKKSSFIWIVILVILICIYFYYNPSSWDLVLDWFRSLN